MAKTPAQLDREIAENLRAPPAPKATLLLRRPGPYTEDDAVLIGTARGDTANSHSAVFKALRAAQITPNIQGVGSFKITFDP